MICMIKFLMMSYANHQYMAYNCLTILFPDFRYLNPGKAGPSTHCHSHDFCEIVNT